MGNSAYAKNLKVEQKLDSDTAEIDAITVNILLTVPTGTVSTEALSVQGAVVDFNALPTSAVGLDQGRVWNNGGVLNIVL